VVNGKAGDFFQFQVYSSLYFLIEWLIIFLYRAIPVTSAAGSAGKKGTPLQGGHNPPIKEILLGSYKNDYHILTGNRDMCNRRSCKMAFHTSDHAALASGSARRKPARGFSDAIRGGLGRLAAQTSGSEKYRIDDIFHSFDRA
jgi:hypothetical protein